MWFQLHGRIPYSIDSGTDSFVRMRSSVQLWHKAKPSPFHIRVRMALKRPIGSTDLKSFFGFDTQPRIFQPPSASKPQNRHRKQQQKHLKPRLRKLATEPFLLDGTAGEVKLAVYKNVFVELVQLPLGQSRWHLSDSSKQPSTG